MTTKDESILEAAASIELAGRLLVSIGADLRALVVPPPPPPPPDPQPRPTGVWTSAAEIASKPTSGPAWSALLAAANAAATPDLVNQDDGADVRVMARGLVFARTADPKMRAEVIAACARVVGTEGGARALALGRNLPGYVIAADLVGYREARFVNWLGAVRYALTTGGPPSLVRCHETRPNNWGTHAGAARAAIAAYIGDAVDLKRCAQVFRGWLGDRSSYAGFEYSTPLDWHADPTKPVGVNPLGATRNGHSIDGALPDDQRRSGAFGWPPPQENYVWEALQGALAQAVILSRSGYPDVWEWSDRALLRAYQWLYEQAQYPAGGDDTWQPHVVNKVYGTKFPAPVPSSPGKNAGWTCWTHA